MFNSHFHQLYLFINAKLINPAINTQFNSASQRRNVIATIVQLKNVFAKIMIDNEIIKDTENTFIYLQIIQVFIVLIIYKAPIITVSSRL